MTNQQREDFLDALSKPYSSEFANDLYLNLCSYLEGYDLDFFDNLESGDDLLGKIENSDFIAHFNDNDLEYDDFFAELITYCDEIFYQLSIKHPYINEHALQFRIDNDDNFAGELSSQAIASEVENMELFLGDYITMNATPENKAMQWAEKNFHELEFCLESNPSFYCDNSKIGLWVKCDQDCLGKAALLPCRDGIFIGTIPRDGEIEVQAENGGFAYISNDGYFKILARVA